MTADLSAIIARLEAAEVGSAELDYLIDEAFSEWKNIGGGWAAHKVTGARRNNHFDYPDSVTTSLDAALALAERVLGNGPCVLHRNGPIEWGFTYVDDDTAYAATPAISVCAAVLRAKQGEGA